MDKDSAVKYLGWIERDVSIGSDLEIRSCRARERNLDRLGIVFSMTRNDEMKREEERVHTDDHDESTLHWSSRSDWLSR